MDSWNSPVPNFSLLLTDDKDIGDFSLLDENDPLAFLNDDDDDDLSSLIIPPSVFQQETQSEDFDEIHPKICPTPMGESYQVVQDSKQIPFSGILLSESLPLSQIILEEDALLPLPQAIKSSNNKIDTTTPFTTAGDALIVRSVSPNVQEATSFGNVGYHHHRSSTPPLKVTSSEDSSSSSSRSQQTSRWNERFLELVEYRKLYGHCNVPYLWPKNRPLSEWVKRQRHQYKIKGTALTPERQALLSALGFVWDSRKSLWDSRYQELLAFYQEFGHVRVTKKNPKYRALSVWLKRQRHSIRLYLAGDFQNTCMTQERIDLLVELGVKINPVI